ncbi:MAG: hypothetical protein ACRDWB_08430 [Acidimicrobiales bacterium]
MSTMGLHRREEEMGGSEVPELASDGADAIGAMHRVIAELGEIAAEVARVLAVASPTMELLEASRAIQSALVSLSDWNGSHDERVPVSGAGTAMLTLSDAWMAFRPHDPWDRVRSTSLDA